MFMPFNGERLKEARCFRQLSITQHTERITVPKQMFLKYENNVIAIK